ncbi:hypothetical protein STSP_18750 [Streptomyces jeddahensis]|uniref:Uncharacterized protein n=1 Tax=Streptomyces jeddahensis TaxID=1716141 RepID=A0A177HXF6_9ACTN|nr:hypothetical protein STSP_18750 [Streptomyces jeddahensis]
MVDAPYLSYLSVRNRLRACWYASVRAAVAC